MNQYRCALSQMIDITFDFRTDAGGSDPDSRSPRLKEYHHRLWSKPLPSGENFTLADAGHRYLMHVSALGTFFLSSDSVMQTFTRWRSMEPIISQIDASLNEEFQRITYTIGGMILFPGNRVDGKMTINGARGIFRTKIADRFDLTLECIRRHYAGEESPLGSVLARYPEFFSLFGDFAGYVRFFLLDDLVAPGGQVQFFTEFDDFESPAQPIDLESYLLFRSSSIAFVEARNRRIAALGL